MADLNTIIQNSKQKIMQSFYKITKIDDQNYSITEYVGPKKSLRQMMYQGWRRFESLKNQINESYPILDINDFKAVDERTIQRKDEQDILKEQLSQYLRYYELSQDLYNAVKNLKDLFTSLSIPYMNFQKFLDLQTKFNSSLNSNTIDGAKYLSLFSTYTENIYLQMEKLKISNPRDLFNDKFMYFLALIK